MEIYDNENLKRLMEECIKEVHENTCYIRFDTSKIKRIYASDTIGKVLGRCHRTKTANGWEFEIIIFRHENRTEKGIKETIIHELIHTLDGCFNHRRDFKYNCEVIKRKLGYDAWKGGNDFTSEEYKLSNFKYFNYCPTCHEITSYSNKKTKRFYANGYIHLTCHCDIKHATHEEMEKIVEVWANA